MPHRCLPAPRASFAPGAALVALALVALGGCTAPGARPEPDLVAELSALTPRLEADTSVLDRAGAAELREARLIGANLVAALVQVPGLRPIGTTLTLNPPSTLFGLALVRAFEDAGYGLQLVGSDQGRHYVSYSRRVGETESGSVTDYLVAVGPVRLTREYAIHDGAVLPGSLLRLEGTDATLDMAEADALFASQGVDALFVSGALDTNSSRASVVDTVQTFSYDAAPGEPIGTAALLGRLGREAALAGRTDAPDPARFEPFRRAVLIFDDPDAGVLGAANKAALQRLSRDVGARDRIVVRACRDFDLRDEAAEARALRVDEELVGLGLADGIVYLAPCVGASYRPGVADAPAPVVLVHLKPRLP